MSVTVAPQLASCRRCPRLVRHRAHVAQQYPDYHAAPVGSWGDRRGRLMIVGLAPGLHGAARTGKAFVGDASGSFLFAALFRAGFASHADPTKARLRNALITNVAKCLPPGNAPSAAELSACAGYLTRELGEFHPPRARRSRVIVALGGVAYRALCRQFAISSSGFAHGAVQQPSSTLHLVASFHPSRLNVNTKRLTAPMLDRLFAEVHKLL